MKKTILFSILILFFTASAHAADDHHVNNMAHDEHASSTDYPVKDEMILLDAAYKNLLDALLLDKPERIEEPFHAVHRAKMATEKALHEGKVELPKNNDKQELFVEMDEAFHDKLKKLLGAARKKDKKAIAESAHEILDACIECHTMFRN